MEVSFSMIRPGMQRDTLVALNVEYFSWLSAEMEKTLGTALADQVGMPIHDYVSANIGRLFDLRPPHGLFYFAEVDGDISGMGGFRMLDEKTVELKRIYVRPGYRNLGIGALLVGRLLNDARACGMARVLLDSAPFQKSAHRLYRRLGFIERGPYEETEAPKALHSAWCFFEVIL